MNSLKRIDLIVFVFFLFFLAGLPALAQRSLEVQYPEFAGIKPETTAIPFLIYFKYVFTAAIAMGGLISFGSFIFAGFKYVTSAGNPTAMGDAKNRIFSTVLGLLVLFGSYLILGTINTQLVGGSLPSLPRCACSSPVGELDSGCKKICQSSAQSADDQQTLSYKEVPLGEILGALLDKNKLEAIKNISEETAKLASDVKIKADDLKKETERCGCTSANSVSPTGGCRAAKGDCASKKAADCVNNCGTCQAPAEGMSCPNQAAIDQKGTALTKAAKELAGVFLPEGAANEGVYLCKKDFCRGKENEDWAYFKPDQREVKNLPGGWDDKAAALAIIGPYEVRIFEHNNLQTREGRYICFDDSVPLLADYEIKDPGGSKNRWNSTVSSLKILDPRECSLPGVTLQGPFGTILPGQLPSEVPTDGVYLCEGDQCKGNWRGATQDIADLCGSDPENRDWAKPANNKACVRNSKIGSVGIKGDFDVMLYEKNYFQGRKICFQDSVGRLDDYLIAPGEGWNLDADSIKILADGQCPNPGVTMLGPSLATVGGLKATEAARDDFADTLRKLQEARALIKNCSSQYSESGESQNIFSYSEFWQYREYLEKTGLIKKTSPSYPFAGIGASANVSGAVFYCADSVFKISLSSISEHLLKEGGGALEDISSETPKKEPVCGPEIEIGRAVDQAIVLGEKVLKELDALVGSSQSAVFAGLAMAKYSDTDDADGYFCGLDNCSANPPLMNTRYRGGCPYSQACKWNDINPDTEEMECRSFEKTEYASCGDCTYYEYDYCDSCSCYCGGSGCPWQITGFNDSIGNNYLIIENSLREIEKLIKENVPEELRFSKILEKAGASRLELAKCVNSLQTREKIESGQGGILKELYDCDFAIQSFGNRMPLYDKDGKEISACYGQTQAAPEAMNNFFCCQSEISPSPQK